MTLASGTKFGAYELVALLGKGGMGEVYRATDTKLHRDVAIKVLPAELATDAERLARFEREARLLASLNHPNIAHVYGFESAALLDGSSAYFLAMELVEGEELAERIERGAMPVEETIDIAKQIAEALEAAHEKGIIHRDLKPANVKITPEGKVFSTGLRRNALFAAKVDPALDPPLGTPALVFRLGGPDQSSGGASNDFDVTVDGQRLLVLRPGPGAAARRMVLVQNWLTEFERRGAR